MDNLALNWLKLVYTILRDLPKKYKYIAISLIIILNIFGFLHNKQSAKQSAIFMVMDSDNIQNAYSQYWDSSWITAWGSDSVWVADGFKSDDQMEIPQRKTPHWQSVPNDGKRYPSRIPISNESISSGKNKTSILLRWNEKIPSGPGQTWTASIFGMGNGKPVVEGERTPFITYDLDDYDYLEFYIKGSLDGQLLIRLEDDSSSGKSPAPNSTQPLPLTPKYFVNKSDSISINSWTRVRIPLNDYLFNRDAYPGNTGSPNRKRIKQISFSSTQGSGDILISQVFFSSKNWYDFSGNKLITKMIK